ncbi:MAG: hypothetical protein V4736_03445, partial [Bdellovibrionota bacterium]
IRKFSENQVTIRENQTRRLDKIFQAEVNGQDIFIVTDFSAIYDSEKNNDYATREIDFTQTTGKLRTYMGPAGDLKPLPVAEARFNLNRPLFKTANGETFKVTSDYERNAQGRIIVTASQIKYPTQSLLQSLGLPALGHREQEFQTIGTKPMLKSCRKVM